ncbi:zf-TFIIB domain-containing protein [Photobacterium sp. 1_MG-2023]|uniref:TFIIB-type zinc ribbon-containing protein n=1 Tax=Photobacterium sp. 1_MG-2023 TaxID=3062646 RepID=UPI0026E18BFA|nr:zf-TFIIB domain-containing protein [Photobacterium sp. 1_MG-2023]MDO6705534.1 zf-TFIIB domain-containing protein [Photobacterium sp. 1_MG-2023]
MKCTSCKQGHLTPSFIEGQFRAHTCSSCEGNWILIEDFVAWKDRNPDYQFSEQIDFEQESQDTKKALLCPVTGTIMNKFRISAQNDHRVDYSAAVGGLWLDRGEWELLKSEGLAGTLNAVVTKHWQHQIREQSTQHNFRDIYQDKFGAENYAKVKAFREWLQSQPQKADLRAYLLAEDPYSAEK